MNILIPVFILFLSSVFSSEKLEEDQNAFDSVGSILNPLKGLQCRKGYNNLSDEVYDSVNHCAEIKRPKESRLVFNDARVYFDGPTPRWCMATCFIRGLGIVNNASNGFDEERLLAYMLKWMSNSGGEASAKDVTNGLMGCEKRHPTEFPRIYKDCFDTKPFFQCCIRVLEDCRDTKSKTDVNFNRAFPSRSIDLN